MGQSPPGHTYNKTGDGLPFLQGSAEFGPISPHPIKWCSKPQRIALPGDLLISVRAPVGDMNIADQRLAVGRGLAVIRGSEKAATAFLALAVEARLHQLKAASGSGMFESITKRGLLGTFIPIPHAAKKQHRIVDLFHTFSAAQTHARRQANCARRIRVDIASSIWQASSDSVPLSHLGEISTGKTPPTAVEEYWTPGVIPFFTPGDLDGRLILDDGTRQVSNAASKAARILPPHTVAQVCIGATLGKAAVLDVSGFANQQINCLSGLDRNDATLLAALLACPRGQERARSRAGQTTLPILKKSAWESLEVPWPAQNERASLANALRVTDRLEQTQRDHMMSLDLARRAVLRAIMDGGHEIPASYDRFLGSDNAQKSRSADFAP